MRAGQWRHGGSLLWVSMCFHVVLIGDCLTRVLSLKSLGSSLSAYRGIGTGILSILSQLTFRAQQVTDLLRLRPLEVASVDSRGRNVIDAL